MSRDVFRSFVACGALMVCAAGCDSPAITTTQATRSKAIEKDEGTTSSPAPSSNQVPFDSAAQSPADAGPFYRESLRRIWAFPYNWRHKEVLEAVELDHDKVEAGLAAYIATDRGVLDIVRKAHGSTLWDFVGSQRLDLNVNLPKLDQARRLATYLLLRGNYHASNGQPGEALACYLAARRVAYHIAADPLGVSTGIAVVIELDCAKAMSRLVNFPLPLRKLAIDECIHMERHRMRIADMVEREHTSIRNTIPLLAREVSGVASDANRFTSAYPEDICAILRAGGLDERSPWILDAQSRLDAYCDRIAVLASPVTLKQFVMVAGEPLQYAAAHSAEIKQSFHRGVVETTRRLADAKDREHESALLDQRNKAMGRHLCVLAHCLLVPDFGSFAREMARAEATSRGVLIGLALANYREEEGEYPDRLSDLVPLYLPAIWADPFDGQAYRYRGGGHTYLLYSVGPDFDDDGGVPDQSRPASYVFIDDIEQPDPARKAALATKVARGEDISPYAGIDGDLVLSPKASDGTR